MKHKSYVHIYRDKKKEWRFRVLAKNGRILAESSESYKRKAGVLKGLDATRKMIQTAFDILE